MSRYTAEYWDHRRDELKHEWRPGDPLPLDQRCALAQLVGYCEGIAKSGVLDNDLELKLRRNVAAVLVAFNMPAKADRAKEIA